MLGCCTGAVVVGQVSETWSKCAGLSRSTETVSRRPLRSSVKYLPLRQMTLNGP